MKKIVYSLIFINLFQLFALSISDFSLKYEKNNKYYNFYDDPAILFDIFKQKNTLEDIGIGYSKDYSFTDCFFTVLSREFEKGFIDDFTLNQLEHEFKVKNPNCYYEIYYFEAYSNFSTIRGISIGDDINKVIEKYPESVLYKNNNRYKWEKADCYFETKIKKPKKLSDIGYIVLESANWQYNRSFDVDCPMHYELVFVIKDCKVKSIVMQYVLDAI